MSNRSLYTAWGTDKSVARALGVALAIAVPDIAQAQAATIAPQGTPKNDNSVEAPGGIQDIIVTARKRTENLRDVPVSVTAVSGATLQANNIVRLTDLVTLIPNFTISNGGLLPLSYIRGFGSAGNASFEQSVGKFVDNVSFGRDFDARIPLFDLDRVEVLRGPQVLLYGNSTTAGAMNITTKKPGDRFEADLSAGYEFVDQETMIQGGVTTPLASWASLRVAGLYQDLSRGWIYNEGNGRHEPTITNWAIRPTLRLEPAPGLKILLKSEVDRLRDRGSTAQQITQSTVPARQVPDAVLDDLRNTNYDVAPFFQNEFGTLYSELYQGDVSYDLAGGTLTSTTAFRHAHFGSSQENAASPATLSIGLDQRYRQLSEEIRYSGRAGALDYLVGGYYQDDTVGLFSFQNFDLAPYGIPVPQFARFFTWDQRAKSYSAFADLTYHFTSAFSIEAGARYSVIRKMSDQASNPANFVPDITFDTPRSAGVVNPALNGIYTAVVGGIPHTFFDIPTHENHLQPQIVAQYRFLPRSQIFLKFVEGDKAGGVDSAYNGSIQRGANTSDAQFASERAVSFEGGIKGITADSRFEYSLTVYNTTISNLQAGIFLGTTLFTTNVGKARSRGAELELTYAPISGLTINGTAASQNAKYLSYPNASCTVAQTQLVPPCSPPGGQDLSGAPLPFASKFTGTAGATYRTKIDAYQVVGAGSVSYRSLYNTTTNNDHLGDQPGFVSVDAHIEAGPDSGWWTVSLFGRNLTDYKYREYGVATPLIPGAFNAFVARGRQLGIRLGAKFN